MRRSINDSAAIRLATSRSRFGRRHDTRYVSVIPSFPRPGAAETRPVVAARAFRDSYGPRWEKKKVMGTNTTPGADLEIRVGPPIVVVHSDDQFVVSDPDGRIDPACQHGFFAARHPARVPPRNRDQRKHTDAAQQRTDQRLQRDTSDQPGADHLPAHGPETRRAPARRSRRRPRCARRLRPRQL